MWEDKRNLMIGKKRLEIVDMRNCYNGGVLVELRTLDEAKRAIEELHEIDFMGAKITVCLLQLGLGFLEAYYYKKKRGIINHLKF